MQTYTINQIVTLLELDQCVMHLPKNEELKRLSLCLDQLFPKVEYFIFIFTLTNKMEHTSQLING